MYGFHNLIFMNRLLFLILLISIISIYAGILLIFVDPESWTENKIMVYTNIVVNIIFEISSVLIIWIVGFKFIDSAMKLDTIEAIFEEKRRKANRKQKSM